MWLWGLIVTATVAMASTGLPDFDGDGTVGFSDFVIFAAKFGLSEGDDGYDARYDLNGDGAIGFSDFLIFAQNFGKEAPSPVVTIPDPNLRAVIAEALGKAGDAPITVADMKTLTELSVPDAGISELTGLESAVNLIDLDLSYNEITDLSPLSGLTDLMSLNLRSNEITDLSPLSGLTSLASLVLTYNPITDISPVDGLTNLTTLWLFHCSVTDISVLSTLTKLVSLDLIGNNAISDISPLAGLTSLESLRLPEDITDISPLSGLTKLIHLTFAGNQIRDISPLARMTDLSSLTLQGNIRNLSPIFGLTKLRSLELTDGAGTNLSTLASSMASWTNLRRLNLFRNNITDISPLAGLTSAYSLQLRENNISDVSPLAGLTGLRDLNLRENNISDISPLAGLTGLTGLVLSYNNITDVSVLEGLTNLEALDLEFNGISDISALAGLTNLDWLSLRGNPLSDSSINNHAAALVSSGVRVFFDPLGPKGDFDIELVFLGRFTETQKKVLQYVARRWMSAVREDLPDYEFTQSWSDACHGQPYVIPAGERIDDLRIYVATGEASGAVGWGGPDLLRQESYLPVVGCMAFDLERANLLITGLHEIGHVLGFGTIWEQLGFYQNPPDGDQHFNGPLAIAAFNDAGGWDYAGRKVPLADPAHWSGRVLSGEVMSAGGGGVLSAITVQSLADLGYGVDVTQADPYTLPGAAGKVVAKLAAPSRPIPRFGMDVSPVDVGIGLTDAAEARPWCGAGLRTDPIYVVDQTGRVVRTIGER